MSSPIAKLCFSHALLAWSSLVAFANSSSAAGADTSAIVILGIVHNPTRCYEFQTICRIIDRVKPGLVLVELDSSFFTPAMTLKPKAINMSLENKADSACLQLRSTPI